MKGHMEKDGFHPHTQYKGVRKSRDQQVKTEGIKIDPRKKRQKHDCPCGAEITEFGDCARCGFNPEVCVDPNADVDSCAVLEREQGEGRKKHDEQMMAPQIKGMSETKRREWEDAVGSEVVKVKKEMINGKPVTSVRFANGEEWFEFDDVRHQEDYMKKEKIEVDESVVGEFVEIEHPDIAGYITMATGKVLFGEREERSKKDGVRLKIGEFKVGDIVMVAPDNDNEGYDSFRGKKLRIVHKATSIEEHQGFDEGLEGEGLYDFETLDGKEIGSSLYDYELVKA